MRQITVVYNIADETEWAKVNPLRYEHNGLKAVRAAAGNALDTIDSLEKFRPLLRGIYEEMLKIGGAP